MTPDEFFADLEGRPRPEQVALARQLTYDGEYGPLIGHLRFGEWLASVKDYLMMSRGPDTPEAIQARTDIGDAARRLGLTWVKEPYWAEVFREGEPTK